tara:strand:+ start:4630 stop:5001 length:372 start_codon:yes stop_codon:yes gene_type:complete
VTEKEVGSLLELAESVRNLEGFQWVPGMLGVYKPRSRGIDSHYKTRFREGMSVRNMSEWLVPDLLDASTAGAMFHQLLTLGAMVAHGQYGDVSVGFGEDAPAHHGRFLGEACAKAAIARGSWA